MKSQDIECDTLRCEAKRLRAVGQYDEAVFDQDLSGLERRFRESAEIACIVRAEDPGECPIEIRRARDDDARVTAREGGHDIHAQPREGIVGRDDDSVAFGQQGEHAKRRARTPRQEMRGYLVDRVVPGRRLELHELQTGVVRERAERSAVGFRRRPLGAPWRESRIDRKQTVEGRPDRARRRHREPHPAAGERAKRRNVHPIGIGDGECERVTRFVNWYSTE